MSWHLTVPSWSTKESGKGMLDQQYLNRFSFISQDIAITDTIDQPQFSELESALAQRAKQPVNQELLTSSLPAPEARKKTAEPAVTISTSKKRKDIDTAPPPIKSAPLSTDEAKLAKQLHKRARQREKRLRKRTAELAAPSIAPPEVKPQSKPKDDGSKKQKKDKTKGEDKPQPSAKKERSSVASEPPPPRQKQPPSSPAVSKLQAQQEKQLKGARFRWLNERLYTIRGEEALAMIQDSPDLFSAYHEGFASQVRAWPVNPVDLIIKELKALPKTAVVADFGCGDAKISASVPQRVHSFDLHAANERVVACDIAHVPLKDSSVDVAVFSLALMGTNLDDFIAEAHRVLKPGGLLKIAEVRSRFDEEHGGLEKFEKALHTAGFDVKKRDVASLMFVKFDFVKSSRTPQRSGLTLKPCIYKRR